MFARRYLLIAFILSSSLYGQLTGSGTGQDIKEVGDLNKKDQKQKTLTEVEKAKLQATCDKLLKEMQRIHLAKSTLSTSSASVGEKKKTAAPGLRLYLDGLLFQHTDKLHKVGDNIEFKCGDDADEQSKTQKESELHKLLLPKLKEYQENSCSRVMKDLGPIENVQSYIILIEGLEKIGE